MPSNTQALLSEARRWFRGAIIRTVSSAPVSQIIDSGKLSQSRVHGVPSWSSSAKAGSSINMRVSAEAPHGTATGGTFSQTAAEMETGCLNYNSVRYVNRGRP